MNRYVFMFAFVVAGVGPARAGGSPTTAPGVVLRAEGESEVAPHGEGNVYAPHVLVEKGRYRMWYGGQGRDGHDRIHYAESADGGTWVRRGVVLEDRKANHVNDPCVVKVGDVYYMYYTRTEKDVVDRIDLAVSKDGTGWEPKGAVLSPGPDGAWDGLSVGRPTVVHEGGVFKMWYDGRKDFPPGAPVNGVPISPTSRRAVGYATSADGLRWTRQGGGPVMGNDAGAVDVKRVGDRFVMVYESREGTRFATSGDGVEWVDGGVLVGRSGGKVDAFGHVTPFLVVEGRGKAGHLFVGAARAATWDRNCVVEVPVSVERLRGIADGR